MWMDHTQLGRSMKEGRERTVGVVMRDGVANVEKQLRSMRLDRSVSAGRQRSCVPLPQPMEVMPTVDRLDSWRRAGGAGVGVSSEVLIGRTQ